MQRVLAAVVALAMLSASGSAAGQHVHAYVDHDHAEHHHGPASHVHAAVPHSGPSDSHAAGDVERVEGCGPGAHAVSVAFISVAPHPDHERLAITFDTVAVVPQEPVWRHLTPSDVRAHSPPRLTDAPLRAPPAVLLA